MSFRRDDDPAARALCEGGGGVGQVADGRDKRCEPPIAEASSQLRRLFAVGLDNEEDCPAVVGLDGRRIEDSDEGAAGAQECGGAVADLATDHVEHDVDLADVLEVVVVQVEELVGALGAGQVPVGGPAGADDVGSGLAGQLYGDRADGAAGAVDEDGLACLQVSVVEQRLLGRQTGHRQCRCGDVVDVGGERCQVAGLHGGVLGE